MKMFIGKDDKRLEFEKVNKANGLVYQFNEIATQIVGEKKEEALILYNNQDRTYMYAPSILVGDDDMVESITDFFNSEDNTYKMLTIKLYEKTSKKSGKPYFDYRLWE